jgi:hypothetical protein
MLARGFRRHLAVFSLAGGLAGAGLLAQRPPAIILPKVAIDGAQLLSDLKVLSADDMEGRKAGTPGGARARAYVIERFKASGIQPFHRTYASEFSLGDRQGPAGPAPVGVNVIGHIPGRRQPARYVVVSAHYDHIGTVDGQVFNGANDNASGTAALFAVGKYFSANLPQHSLIFAAFDAEELNLTGARAFVQKPPIDRASIALDLNADMIGRDANNRLYVSGTFEHPLLKPHVQRVAARAPVTLLMGYDNPKGAEAYWMRSSDQWAFLEARIPALYIGVEDNAQHHKATDDYGNMTHAFFVNAVETLRMLVEEFDKNLP